MSWRPLALVTPPRSVVLTSRPRTTDMLSFMEDIKQVARASRREIPCPADYDISLARFNLDIGALWPHRRNPVARSKLAPSFFDPLDGYPPADRALPLVGAELSGREEKDSKPYVPTAFPAFPSIHTYRYTPEDVEQLTVRGSG